MMVLRRDHVFVRLLKYPLLALLNHLAGNGLSYNDSLVGFIGLTLRYQLLARNVCYLDSTLDVFDGFVVLPDSRQR